jgi:hypothetical protein
MVGVKMVGSSRRSRVVTDWLSLLLVISFHLIHMDLPRRWKCECHEDAKHELLNNINLCGDLSELTEDEWEGDRINKKKKIRRRKDVSERPHRIYGSAATFPRPGISQSPNWHFSEGKKQTTGLCGQPGRTCKVPKVPEGATPEEHLQILIDEGYVVVQQSYVPPFH